VNARITIPLAALLLATAASAEPAAAPAGALQFCIRNPSFCTSPTAAAAKLSDMAAIMRVNRQVNGAILPDPLATDAAKRAENGNWRVVMPGGVGGCVEFVQTKRALLAWAGIPTGAMRMAQVRTKDGEFHAVLLVRVGGQTVVLDNLTPVIWPIDLARLDVVAVQDGWGWVTP
jgi:predicted transglutaminase-like cysteine proteinase